MGFFSFFFPQHGHWKFYITYKVSTVFVLYSPTLYNRDPKLTSQPPFICFFPSRPPHWQYQVCGCSSNTRHVPTLRHVFQLLLFPPHRAHISFSVFSFSHPCSFPTSSMRLTQTIPFKIAYTTPISTPNLIYCSFLFFPMYLSPPKILNYLLFMTCNCLLSVSPPNCKSLEGRDLCFTAVSLVQEPVPSP